MAALNFGNRENVGKITSMHYIHDLLTDEKWTSLTFKTDDVNNLPVQGETCEILNGVKLYKGFKRVFANVNFDSLPYYAEVHFKREGKDENQ